MNRKDDGQNTLLSAAVSSVFFLIVFMIFKWNFFVSAGLSVLSYIGVSLASIPVKKIGGISVEKIDQGERISRIYDTAEKNLEQIKDFGRIIQDQEISKKVKMLIEKGDSILNYLTNNLKSISTSEHFLDYYLGTANRIVKNYSEMEGTSVSPQKAQLIKDETSQSLDYLQELFTKQMDSYYDDKILSLEVESDLLEKTVKLGGGRD